MPTTANTVNFIHDTKHTSGTLVVMKKRYNYRAYPDGAQQRSLSRLFGCVRFTYNQTVAAARAAHEAGARYPGATELQKIVLTRGKAEHPWLGEVSGVPLIQAVRDADHAYRAFFASVTGKRKGPMVGPPRFKSRRDNRQTARFTSASSAGGLRVRACANPRWGEVYLPKIGWLRYRSSRDLPSQPTSVSVRRNPDGTYEVSFVVEAPDRQIVATERVAGLDLGLADFAVIVYSDGTREKVDNPRLLRAAEKRLARAQKALSRTQKGSNNRTKARVVVARRHAAVARRRADFTHKLSTRLSRENQAVAVESLSVAGLGRTRLAKSVHDAGWAQFVQQLADKTTVAAIDRWSPTTRTCSQCGAIGGRKPLSVREWTCPDCGARLDRDYNAALNIMVAAGLAETENACGADVRRALASAVSSETGTHRTDQHTLAA